MAKQKNARVVTPAGVAAYAWLSKPDEGKQYSDGKFKVTLVLDEDTDYSDLEKVCLEEASAKWPGIKPANVKLPFQDGSDKGKEEFTGKTLMTLKSKYKPAQVDAKKRPLPENVSVFSGDLIKCAAVVFPYESTEKVKEGGKTKTVTVRGVSLQLLGVQLLDKRNAGGDGGVSMFDEEDGFVAEGDEKTDEATETTGDDERDF